MDKRFPPLEIDEPEILPSQLQSRQARTQFALSMVIPTRNEAGNIEPLLARITQATRRIPCVTAINPNELHPDGFKILLEILVSHPALIAPEIPIQFGYRNAGDSKDSIRETFRFLRGLFRLKPAGNENFIAGGSGIHVMEFQPDRYGDNP